MIELITIEDDENFLRRTSKKVDFFDPDLAQNIADLKEYTFANRVYAMAAIQLGIAKRLVFIKAQKPKLKDLNEEECICMINPTILSMKGCTEFWEGCQSCLGWIGLVERPYQLVVKYFTEEGSEKIQTFEGFVSTVISHELDHLDGIFHMDRAKKVICLSDENAQEEKEKIRKENEYKVHRRDGEFVYEKLNRIKVNDFYAK